MDHKGDPVLFGEAFRRDPYAVYAKLRCESPVLFDESLGAFVATRYDDVATVLKHPEIYSSNRVELGRHRFADPALAPLLDTLSLLMLQRDDPDHRRLRKLTHHAFERAVVEGYEPRIRAICEDLLTPAAASGRLEFVSEFAVPLPVIVISLVVGIPSEDRERVKRWCDDFSIVALNFYARITDAQLAAGAEAVATFRHYLEARLEEARSSSEPTLLNALVQAEAGGERLSVDEILANVLLLLNAGNETTTILLSNAMDLLLDEPVPMTRLRADPAAIPAAVEEVLRFAAPVHFVGRIATRDSELGGQRVRAGDLVLVFLASTGRDEARFAAPDSLDFARPHNRHQAFGNGPHMCAGLQLARLEARIALETVLQRFRGIAREPGERAYGPNLNLRGLARLPLTVEPA